VIKDIYSLDPKTHTSDMVIDVTDIVKEYKLKTRFRDINYSCIYIKKIKILLCAKDGRYTKRLYMYKVSENNSLTRISLTNTVEQKDDADMFFNAHDEKYFKFT
jgi:hypothetical protein